MSQSELAERAGLDQQAVSRWERGRRRCIRSDVLARLAEALKVSADELLGIGAYKGR